MRRARFQAAHFQFVPLDIEERFFIANAERFQTLEFLGEPQAHGRLDPLRNADGGNIRFLAVIFFQIRAERVFEFFEIFGAHVDARRLRMPAEFFDMLRTGAQRLVNVDTLDGTGRALQ